MQDNSSVSCRGVIFLTTAPAPLPWSPSSTVWLAPAAAGRVPRHSPTPPPNSAGSSRCKAARPSPRSCSEP
eukprot:4889270-Prymnesium_polylepis.1